MIAMIKGAQWDSTTFGCGIVCSRLSRQGSLCKGFCWHGRSYGITSVTYIICLLKWYKRTKNQETL
jgi:hypothetical protein